MNLLSAFKYRSLRLYAENSEMKVLQSACGFSQSVDAVAVVAAPKTTEMTRRRSKEAKKKNEKDA